MNKHNVKNRVLALEKALGQLRQVDIGGARVICAEREYPFSAAVETLTCWSDYGQYNENRLHLMQADEEKPIVINAVEFCPVVRDIHYFQLSSSVQSHRFSVAGRRPSGELFEAGFRIDGDDILSAVVYAMILCAYVDDAALASEYWSALHGGDMRYGSIGEHIDRICDLRRMGRKIVAQHPYMEHMFQEGMKEPLVRLKAHLDRLTLFNEPKV